MFRIDKENFNNISIYLIFFVCYVLLAMIAMRPVFAFDGYWHLQMGKDLLENGLSPWVDHYSFSYLGKEISTVPVLFQMLLHGFVSVFGESGGFYLVKLFYISTLMSVLYLYFNYIKAHWTVVFVLLPIIAYFIHIRLMIRPEIFSNVLVVLCLLFYLKAQKNFNRKTLVWICLLLLFWVNYHSPIMGYIIVFGLFLDKAVSKYFHEDNSFTWVQWVIWGIVIFSIGFIRPNGQHFLFTIFSLLENDFGRYTQEYMASYLAYSRNMLVTVLWVMSSYVVIWSLIRKQYGFALIVVIVTYFSWSTARLIAVAMLINLCVLAVYFTEFYYSRHTLVMRPSIKRTMVTVAFGVSLIAYYLLSKEAIVSIDKYDERDLLLKQRYPVEVVDYLNSYKEEGNVLNLMEIGGYLINKLSPGFKIFFDGRTNILYPIDFFEYNIGLLNNADELNKTIQQNNVKYAVYRNKPDVYSALQKNKPLELNFSDSNFILFAEKNEVSFPRSSMLMVFPSCWQDDWSQDIENEINLSETLFKGRNYDLKIVLEFMKGYLAKKGKKEFFDTLQLDSIHSDAVRRIALYLALHSGNKTVAAVIFKSFRTLTEYDFLIHSYNLALHGEYVMSEDLLYYFYTMKKFVRKEVVVFENIAIMTHILDILEKNNALTKFESAYRVELEEKLMREDFDIDRTLMFGHICKAG